MEEIRKSPGVTPCGQQLQSTPTVHHTSGTCHTGRAWSQAHLWSCWCTLSLINNYHSSASHQIKNTFSEYCSQSQLSLQTLRAFLLSRVSCSLPPPAARTHGGGIAQGEEAEQTPRARHCAYPLFKEHQDGSKVHVWITAQPKQLCQHSRSSELQGTEKCMFSSHCFRKQQTSAQAVPTQLTYG